jgi:hypothetical protein
LTSPCDHLRADALASTASRPAFVTTRDPPLLPERDGVEVAIEFNRRKAIYFCGRGLDHPNHVEMPYQIAVCAQRIFEPVVCKSETECGLICPTGNQ